MHAIVFETQVDKHMVTGKDVNMNQDLIYADGQHVAYVGHQPGAPVNFIVPDPSVQLRQAVLSAVAERFDETDAEPRKTAAPVAVEEILVDDDWLEESDE